MKNPGELDLFERLRGAEAKKPTAPSEGHYESELKKDNPDVQTPLTQFGTSSPITILIQW